MERAAVEELDWVPLESDSGDSDLRDDSEGGFDGAEVAGPDLQMNVAKVVEVVAKVAAVAVSVAVAVVVVVVVVVCSGSSSRDGGGSRHCCCLCHCCLPCRGLCCYSKR